MPKMKMFMVRVAGALVPDGDVSWEIFEKIPQHKLVSVSVQYARNPDLMRKYWAIARAVVDADPGFDDADDADHFARISIPWMRKEYISDESGRLSIRPLSISFDEMDEETFRRFYERAIEIWSARIGMNVEELRAEGERRAKIRRAPMAGDEKDGGMGGKNTR